VGHRADLPNLRTSHTSLRENITEQILLKDRKKKKKKKKKQASLPNNLPRLRQSFCLNTNTRIGC
jgi:hypothetical protein